MPTEPSVPEKILTSITTLIHDLVGHEYLHFDTPLIVKPTPHTPPFNAWAVSISPAKELFVMDADETWHKVEPIGADTLILNSLFQRVKKMSADSTSKDTHDNS